MIKTFRVAAAAAAAGFLCVGATAQAQEQPTASPAIHAVAATPVTPIEMNAAPLATGPTSQADAVATPVTAHASADTILAPGRGRPDRFEAPLMAAPPLMPVVTATAEVRRPLVELVAELAYTEIADEQFECLASAIYFESRGEPLEGQLAVAEVILNRVRSGRFRSTICNVVTQPSQFSFVRGGRIPAAPRSSAAWRRAVGIARIAMDARHEVTGNRSLFFHATYVRPNWGRPRIAQIGNHIFYR